ncbi:hypothetical protein IWQ62_004031 [Dispira parvispora]|uniref:Uncharacterized protein n=1 Tax=Dispira parvispora TaxID=1520584 RepID=A0A9W8AT64_9FUNG|nr:hypothetical protein IWQ62_004031 [Dispira parvispora]
MYTGTTVRLILIAVVGTFTMGTQNSVAASLPSTNLANGAAPSIVQNLVRRTPFVRIPKVFKELRKNKASVPSTQQSTQQT